MDDKDYIALASRVSNIERALVRQSDRELPSIPQASEGTIGDERFVRIGEEYRLYKKFPSGWKYSVMYISRPDMGPATALDELTDVTIASPSAGQVLKYGSGGVWINDTSPITAHDITSVYHTASGLTTGHFIKATGANTFAFSAHGLTYSDVGAEQSGSVSSHASVQTGVHGISITAAKVFTCTGTLTLSGTDGSTLNIGTGGTLGTAAYTAATAYAAASHAHAGADITSGTIDGDRLPAISTTKKGGVPATGSPSGKYLKDDGTWATISSAGDVVGPASATDNAIVRFDSTTGKLIQNSVVTIDDSGTMNIPTGQTYNINGSAHTHDHGALLNDGIVSHNNLDNHYSDSNVQHVPSHAGNSGKVLSSNGTIGVWTTAGTGDVAGPGSSTDNALVRFDSTTGKLIQNSLATVDDSGSMNIPTGQTYKINGTAHTHTAFGALANTDVLTISKTGSAIHVSVKINSGDTYVAAGLGTNGTVGILYLNDDVSGAPWSVTAYASGFDFGGAVLETDGGYSLNGAAGQSATITVITALQYSGTTLQKKSRDLTFAGGIITTVGAESAWVNV